MTRVRQRIQQFGKTYCVRSQSSLQFVEGVNQLTFENDHRFDDANIISGELETSVPKECLRDLGCLGSQTHVNGGLRKGDNVDANFQG